MPSNKTYLIAIIFLIISVAIIDKIHQKMNPAAARKAAVEAIFNNYDGSSFLINQEIKAHLKDPDSYKHVETKYIDNGAGNITVYTKFRAKNSFNATIP